MFRRGDIKNALPVIDSLVEDLPQNPYFWELKGQALLENGRAAEAVAPLQQAVKLLPNNGLIQMLLAQALIGTESKANAQAALKMLHQAQNAAKATCRRSTNTWPWAYGLTGDVAQGRTGHRRGGAAAGRQETGDREGQVGPGPFQDRHAGMDAR